MSPTVTAIDRFSVSSNARNLKSVIEAVNAVIRTETLILANRQGIENPSIPQYNAGDLFQRYSYRCRKVRANWFQHTFVLKAVK